MDIETSRIPNIQTANIGSKAKPHYALKGFVELDAWTGYFLYDETFKLKKHKVVTNGQIDLWIDGVAQDGSVHISQEQVNAYFNLVEQQEGIKYSILQKLKKEFPNLLQTEYASWDHEDPIFPGIAALSEDFDFKNFIGPKSISIDDDIKDGVAYLTWNFNCRWDIEHGFSVITHKDRVIDIGPEVDIWKIYEDNGTYEEEQQDYDRRTFKKLPMKKKWWQFW
jgi:hypothetical protein